jgi:gliding motility-associated-like protein
MRNTKLKILFLSVLLVASVLSFSQVVLNNGGQINALHGAYIYVNGSVVNQNSGLLSIEANVGVNAELYVTGDITNDATISDDGHIRLLGNWFDNNVFIGGTGTVFFEGTSQILGGTAATVFNNITLDGSGLKTQTIDKYAVGILNLKHLELQTETNTFFVQNANPASILRTTGFVSSLNGGKLSRNTNSSAVYLFPVGSSVGTLRYRPVEIIPDVVSNNTYAVRLANLNASVEGYNVNNIDSEICEVNPIFYHQIARTSGASSADIQIYFDETTDGDWDGISKWNIMPPQWESITGSFVNSGVPFDVAIKTNWDDFSNEPYILFRNTIPISFADLGPYCIGETPDALPASSVEGVTGTWSPSVINTSAAGTTIYVFTPAAGQACFETYSMSVTVEVCCNINLTASVINAPCYGTNGQVIFSSTGGIPPLVYTVNGAVASSPYSGVSGNYTVLVTDAVGCTASGDLYIGQPAILQVFVTPSPAHCGGVGGSAFASVAGGTANYDFVWSNTQTGNSINNLDPGTYSVVVTDDNNCTANNFGVVAVTGSIDASIVQLNPISCPGLSDGMIEAVSANAVAPANYLWNDGSISSVLSNLGSGNYIVNISDSWGCSGTAFYTLINPSSIQINATVNQVRCFGEDNGSIDLGVSGGFPPYNFVWSNAFNGSNNIDLIGGEYFVTIIDTHNCSVSANYIVPEPSELVLSSAVQNISCFGNTDGGAVLSATGGVIPYVFNLSGNSLNFSGNTHYSLPVGTYNIQVTDHSLCVATSEISISEPGMLAASYEATGPSCIGNNDGFVEVAVYGGTEPYLFRWDQNTIDIPYLSGLIQGSYDISVVDANNCVFELGSVNLTDFDQDCITIPNAFTPNGDGVNDTWIIENLEMFPNSYVYVFNRWGQLIYTGLPGDEWNGRFNDNGVPATSYIYIVDLNNRMDSYVGLVTVVY